MKLLKGKKTDGKIKTKQDQTRRVNIFKIVDTAVEHQFFLTSNKLLYTDLAHKACTITALMDFRLLINKMETYKTKIKNRKRKVLETFLGELQHRCETPVLKTLTYKDK